MNILKQILSYVLTTIYLVVFGSLILLFHPLQVITYSLMGVKAHKTLVDYLNYLLIRSLILLSVDYKIFGKIDVPSNRPVIIISNHQSMFDIPAIIWALRKLHPRFVSKKELGKGFPSISYNLRKSQAALIDRKDRKQSVVEIQRLGRLIHKENSAACIFPEGTRSKTGKLRRFNSTGVDAMLQAAPNAVILPFVIDGHARLVAKGFFPLACCMKLRYTILPVIDPANRTTVDVLEEVRAKMAEKLDQ
ncbi:MAG: lysophospholipid acyltransferase family protein [Bacteroidales bacterium]